MDQFFLGVYELITRPDTNKHHNANLMDKTNHKIVSQLLHSKRVSQVRKSKGW